MVLSGSDPDRAFIAAVFSVIHRDAVHFDLSSVQTRLICSVIPSSSDLHGAVCAIAAFDSPQSTPRSSTYCHCLPLAFFNVDNDILALKSFWPQQTEREVGTYTENVRGHGRDQVDKTVSYWRKLKWPFRPKSGYICEYARSLLLFYAMKLIVFMFNNVNKVLSYL